MCLERSWTVLACKRCLIWAYFSPDSDEKLILWIISLKLKKHSSLHQTWLKWFGLLVYYCDVIISCLVSHSDGTHSLQSIHCWASDVMLHFSKSVLMKSEADYANVKMTHMTWHGHIRQTRHTRSYPCPNGGMKYRQQCTRLSNMFFLFSPLSSLKYCSNCWSM